MEQPDIEALKAITWLTPWEPFPAVQMRTESGITGYDLELVREVGPKHPLFPYKRWFTRKVSVSRTRRPVSG